MITEVARAKVNLFLEITGRRRDGYHTLDTVFQEIDLCDRLRFRRLPGSGFRVKILCAHQGVPKDSRNLAWKAADLLHEAARRAGIRSRCFPVEISIGKKIPPGGGLGGGSSDAAATLRGLNRLWNLRLSSGSLRRLAKKLGADVPFFLVGGRCRGTGLGDRLTRMRSGRLYMALAHPGFGVSTPQAYARHDRCLTGIGLRVRMRYRECGKRPALIAPPGHRGCRTSVPALFNRLENVVAAWYPRIAELKAYMLALGADRACMSGSGSCVYGVVPTRRAAAALAGKLRRMGFMAWAASAA